MQRATASDIMTRDVKAVPAHTKLKDVGELMVSGGFSGVPVVDEAENLIGIISESDLLNEDKRNGAIPRTAIWGFHIPPDDSIRKAYDDGWTLQARDLMTRNPVTASEDTSVEELADIMVRRRINRIPIVKDRKLVGIVTREDLLRGILHGRAEEAAV